MFVINPGPLHHARSMDFEMNDAPIDTSIELDEDFDTGGNDEAGPASPPYAADGSEAGGRVRKAVVLGSPEPMTGSAKKTKPPAVFKGAHTGAALEKRIIETIQTLAEVPHRFPLTPPRWYVERD